MAGSCSPNAKGEEDQPMSSTVENRSPGRPKFLDEVKRAEICALVSSGCSYRNAARYVGCTVQAISALAKRDPEFAEQLEKAIAQREAFPLASLREASKRSWRAAVFLLKMNVGGRFGGHVPTLEEEAESERLEAAFSIPREAPEPNDDPPQGVQEPHRQTQPSTVAPKNQETKPETKGQSKPKAKQRPTQHRTNPPPAFTNSKKMNAASSIRQFMDELDAHWQRVDALEDERFFDPNYDDT
jgi:hypothetical protein